MSTLHYLKQITNMLYQIKDLCKNENLRKWLTKFNILPQKIINKYKIEVFKQQLKEKKHTNYIPNKMKIDTAARKFIIACFDSDWFDCKPFGRFSRFFSTNANTIQFTIMIIATGRRKA